MADILDSSMYRKKLTIPSNVRFGLEIELENVSYDEVLRLVRNRFGNKWAVKDDASLLDGGAEIVTPVLINEKDTWLQLKKLVKILNILQASYDHCSFQVNFDGSVLPTDEDRITFIKLFAMYEDIIFRFSKGEDSQFRESLKTYASPILNYLPSLFYFNNKTIVDYFSDNKHFGFCFKSKKDLIEFRTPNGTSNSVLWQNYITFFYYFLQYASKFKSTDIIDEYISNNSNSCMLHNYELEKEEKALSLAKSIFEDSTDLSYFMRQYLKK